MTSEREARRAATTVGARGRPEVDELGASLVADARTAEGVTAHDRRRGGDVEPSQRLERRGAHERDDALALCRGRDGALEGAQTGVEVVGPVARAAHQLAHDLDGELGTVEGRARLGAPHPGLGRGLRDASAQGLVEAEPRAGVPGCVGAGAHVGQVGQRRELVEQHALLGGRAGGRARGGRARGRAARGGEARGRAARDRVWHACQPSLSRGRPCLRTMRRWPLPRHRLAARRRRGRGLRHDARPARARGPGPPGPHRHGGCRRSAARRAGTRRALGSGLYRPKWTSSHYTLLQLGQIGLAPRTRSPGDGGAHPRQLQGRRRRRQPVAARQAERCLHQRHGAGLRELVGASEDSCAASSTCCCARAWRTGASTVGTTVLVFVTHSSVHTTVCVIEGITAYLRHAGALPRGTNWSGPDASAASSSSSRLFRSESARRGSSLRVRVCTSRPGRTTTSFVASIPFHCRSNRCWPRRRLVGVQDRVADQAIKRWPGPWRKRRQTHHGSNRSKGPPMNRTCAEPFKAVRWSRTG